MRDSALILQHCAGFGIEWCSVYTKRADCRARNTIFASPGLKESVSAVVGKNNEVHYGIIFKSVSYSGLAEEQNQTATSDFVLSTPGRCLQACHVL